MPASWQRSRSSSHDLGRNRSLSSRAFEPAVGHDQMHGDDAVGHLARAAEILPLHARGLGALLERTGLVENEDGAHRVGRQLGDRGTQPLLHPIGQAFVVPQTGFEKLLQTAGRGARILGQRLGRLAVQVGEQPAGIIAKMLNGFRTLEKPLERPQKRREFRADGLDLIRGHGDPSQG